MRIGIAWAGSSETMRSASSSVSQTCTASTASASAASVIRRRGVEREISA